MKRNWFLMAVLMLAVCGMVCGVVYLNNPEKFHKQPDAEVIGNRPAVQQRDACVTRGRMPHNYRTTGTADCILPEGYLEMITAEYTKDGDFELLKDRGSDLAAGEALYSLNKKEYIIGFRARVIDVSYESEGNTKCAVIRLLNFEKLGISTSVRVDMLKKISYETEIAVRVGEEEYQGKIGSIGFVITNGMVPVRVFVQGNMLPGAEAELVFTYEVRENALKAPADMFYQLNNCWNADVAENGRLVRREVELGERFTDPDDGILYAEILSGLKEGERLIVEELKDPALTETENILPKESDGDAKKE